MPEVQYTHQDLDRLKGLLYSPKTKHVPWKGMLYGPSGVGKSVEMMRIMQALVPTDKYILYIEVGDGWTSLKNHEEEGLLERTQAIPFTDLHDIQKIAEAIHAGEEPWSLFGGIVLDEASAMVRMTSDKYFRDRRTNDKAPGWEDYHAALVDLRNVMTLIFNLKDTVHLGLVAHEKNVKSDQGKVIGVKPDFIDSVLEEVKRPLITVARLDAVAEKDPANLNAPLYRRTAQVHKTKGVDAKTRIASPVVSFDTEFLKDMIVGWTVGKLKGSDDDIVIEERVADVTEIETSSTEEEAMEIIEKKMESGSLESDDMSVTF